MGKAKRYLYPAIQEWLPKRMVFIGGPRQVGTTYLSKQFVNSPSCCLNLDDIADRQLLK